MAIRNIFKEGEPILRQKAKPVTAFDARLGALLDDMKETMQRYEGTGIAAPQVGIMRRAVIVEHEGKIWEMVNPKILSENGSVVAYEGCLSVDHRKDCEVERPQIIEVEYQDRHGERIEETVADWRARIICHEVDHLNGILFIDKKYVPKKKK